jgi:hypothetical protein
MTDDFYAAAGGNLGTRSDSDVDGFGRDVTGKERRQQDAQVARGQEGVGVDQLIDRPPSRFLDAFAGK